jgi:hypothetical protein
MTRTPENQGLEVPRTARTRVRLPDGFAPARLFAGWGPELGR